MVCTTARKQTKVLIQEQAGSRLYETRTRLMSMNNRTTNMLSRWSLSSLRFGLVDSVSSGLTIWRKLRDHSNQLASLWALGSTKYELETTVKEVSTLVADALMWEWDCQGSWVISKKLQIQNHENKSFTILSNSQQPHFHLLDTKRLIATTLLGDKGGPG